MAADRVQPRTLKGFVDHLPPTMIQRQRVIDKVRAVYERYGFQPLETPALESLDALLGTGGEETNKQLFTLESPEEEPIALRFDLTVPFARVLAQYLDELKLPFRRYHVGPVWRADKPDPGRYRQFTQFDIDAAGCDRVEIDAEIIAASVEAFTAIGLGADEATAFQVRINSRRLVDALLEDCGIHDAPTQKHVLRVVDKLDKIGADGVHQELGPGRVDSSGAEIRGVGLAAGDRDRIMRFLAITGDTRQEVVDAVAAALPQSELAEDALQSLRELDAALAALGIEEQTAIFDPSLARGLDYYTGSVFETILPAAPQFGSVMGGGRYDNLVERFLEEPIPATGASIGVDRLLAALQALEVLPQQRTTTQVLIVTFPDTPMPALLELAGELRAAGIASEVFMKSGKTGMRKQMAYANARGIPVAVIVGASELAEGTASVKDLEAGLRQRQDIADHEAFRKAGKTGQVTVARGELIDTVRSILALS